MGASSIQGSVKVFDLASDALREFAGTAFVSVAARRSKGQFVTTSSLTELVRQLKAVSPALKAYADTTVAVAVRQLVKNAKG